MYKEEKYLLKLSNVKKEMAYLKQAHIPLILFLSRSDCGFCHEVRKNYLLPLQKNSPVKNLMIRELVTDKSKGLIDIDGRHVSVSDFLKKIKVSFFPTVIFLGSDMRVLAEPIIGLDQAGFFGAYLEQRLEIARKNSY